MSSAGVTLPRPPRGLDFPGNPNKWACDLENWARVAGGLIEDDSRTSTAGLATTGQLNGYLPLTGGTIDGTLGVGTSPPLDAVDGTILGNSFVGTGPTTLFNNAYNTTSTGDSKLIAAGPATALNMGAGTFRFFAAPSGAPGATPAWAPIATLTPAGLALAASPAPGDNSFNVATTAWVRSLGYVTGGPYLPLSGGNLTGPLTSSSTGTFNGLLQGNAFRAGGNNIGGLSWSGLNSQWNTLANSGAMGVGWNYTNGGGETDFMINRDGGGAGGLNIYDFPNTSGTPQLLMQLNTGGLMVPNEIRTYGSNGSLSFMDRATNNQFSWYASGNIAKLYYGPLGDQFKFDGPSGNMSVSGSSYYFAGVISGNGPRMAGDTTNIGWVLGTGNGSYFWWNNPGAVLATLDNTGYFTANNSVSTGGDLYLNRTSNSYGYVIRPNTAGYKNLGFCTAGGGLLDNVQINSAIVQFNGEIRSTNANILARHVVGSYGVIYYQDGGNFYFLVTNSGDQYGSYNGLRPFHFNLSNGFVSMEQDVWVGPGQLHTYEIVMENARWLWGKDTGGAARPLIGLMSDSAIHVGDATRNINLHGYVVLNNNTPLYGQDTGGAARTLIWEGGDNRTHVGSDDRGMVLHGGVTINLNSAPLSGVDTGGTGRMLIMLYSDNNVYVSDTDRPLWLRGSNVYLEPGTASATYSTSHLGPREDNSWWCGISAWGVSWYNVCSYHFETVSDARFKTDIEDLPDCLDLVRALKPKRYRFTNGVESERWRLHWGFVAQDVGAAMDAAGYDFSGGYRIDKDDRPGHEGEEHHGLVYSDLTAVLWRAVQELAAEVADLKARIV